MLTGSGFGAVNILTPSESMLEAARASDAQTQSQLARATLPDQIALSQDRAAMAGLQLQEGQLDQLVKQKAAHQALIANAAAMSQTPDEWDANLQELADRGVGEARQYVGRYSERLRGQLANGYGAGSPQAALKAMLSESPTGLPAADTGMEGVAGNTGAGVSQGVDYSQYDKLFAGASQAQIKTSFDRLEQIRNGIEAVSRASNPAAVWDAQVQLFDRPDLVGQYSPLRLQQLAQETVPIDNYLRGRMAREAAGVPLPKPAAQIDKLPGGELVSVDTSDPQHPKATVLAGGQMTLVGTDPDTGVGIYADRAGKEVKGTVRLAPKPGVQSNRPSVFAQRQSAWLSAHPGDTQGALDYAAGKQGRQLSPQQVQMAALAQASRELNTLALSGSPPPDGEAWVQDRAAQIAGELNAAPGGGNAPPATAPAAPPASALAVLQEGRVTTFANGQRWTKKNGKPVQVR